LEDAEKRMVEYQGLRPLGRPPGRPPSCFCTPALGPRLQKITELANPGVLHLRRAGSGQGPEGRGEDAGRAENSGGILMRWPWGRRRAIEPRPMVSRVQRPGDGQGDTGGGVLCPARRGGGDDTEEAGGERAGGARTC